MIDFNDAPVNSYDVIPAKTIVKVVLTLRPGGYGADGCVTQSKSSPAQYLDCEFTVIGGEYDKRKFWTNIGITGATLNEKGEDKYADMGRQTIRAILESARGIMPNDTSDRAQKARSINTYNDLNGLEFVCQVGIDEDTTGMYLDKNKLGNIITPNHKRYAEFMNSGNSGNYQPQSYQQPQQQQQTQPIQQQQQQQFNQFQQTQPQQVSKTPAWVEGRPPQQQYPPQQQQTNDDSLPF